jgi:putative CRISPR-associated protein (TIGR02620 family)
MSIIVITRHPALVQYLTEAGIVPAGATCISHADASDVAGKHVIGVLPMRLAALAASVTEVPLDIPAELRGHELTLEQVRQYAGEPVRYVIRTEDRLVEEAVALAHRCDRITGTTECGDAVMASARAIIN